MAYEDFTGYTTVDGQSCLTVVANTITANQIRNSSNDSYVYDDKGAAHFGNFEHLSSGQCYANGNDHGGYCLVWGISDTVNDWNGWIIHGHHHNNHPEKYPFINRINKTINVRVELTNYKPISLGSLLESIN